MTSENEKLPNAVLPEFGQTAILKLCAEFFSLHTESLRATVKQAWYYYERTGLEKLLERLNVQSSDSLRRCELLRQIVILGSHASHQPSRALLRDNPWRMDNPTSVLLVKWVLENEGADGKIRRDQIWALIVKHLPYFPLDAESLHTWLEKSTEFHIDSQGYVSYQPGQPAWNQVKVKISEEPVVSYTEPFLRLTKEGFLPPEMRKRYIEQQKGSTLEADQFDQSFGMEEPDFPWRMNDFQAYARLRDRYLELVREPRISEDDEVEVAQVKNELVTLWESCRSLGLKPKP